MATRKKTTRLRDIGAELVKSLQDMKAGRWSRKHELSDDSAEIAARLWQLAAGILSGEYNALRFRSTETRASGALTVGIKMTKVAQTGGELLNALEPFMGKAAGRKRKRKRKSQA